MNKPKLYIITGLPFAGKSTLARELLKRFGFSHASVDDQITSGNYDVTAMSQEDWDNVYTWAYDKLEALLQDGKSTIFDGASLMRRERQNLRNIAKECNADAVLIYVNTSAEQTMQRRHKNMTTKERAHLKEETMQKAQAMFEVPEPDEHAIIYDTSSELEPWLEKHNELWHN